MKTAKKLPIEKKVKKDQVLFIRVSDDIKKILNKKAKESGRSMAFIVEALVKEYLD